MRKLVWGGTVACLVTGALGAYLAMSSRHAEPTLRTRAEEQEAPVAVFIPIPPAEPLPGSGEADAVEAFEPIVVEANEQAAAPTPTSEIDVSLSGVSPAPPVQQPARPDEEPGQEKKMPYADEPNVCAIPPGMLWEALCRVLTGESAPMAAAEEQAEPAVAMPVKPEEVRAPLSTPAMNYHHYEQCCPYTGRCATPYHPAPPHQ